MKCLIELKIKHGLEGPIKKGNNMQNHTSGPWKKLNHFSGPSEIRAQDTRLICTIEDAPLDAEDQANLNLITAAPEMLEALEIMLRLVEIEYEGTHFPDIVTKIVETEKIIKKAKGL